MSRDPLNKSTYHREKRSLASYEKFLPALDLKRKQLVHALREAQQALHLTEERLLELTQSIGSRIPMLAAEEIEARGWLQILDVHVTRVTRLGVSLEQFERVDFEASLYGFLVRPHWTEALVGAIEEAATLRIRRSFERRTVARLEAAVRETTRRVNLFEKILIPGTIRRLRQISVRLADEERAGMIRAKIAKRRAEGGAER